jgi:DNA-binding Xre family transcriptional regulator
MGDKMKVLSHEIKLKRNNKIDKDLAIEIGISTATLWRICKGAVPGYYILRKICAWLEMKPEEFQEFEEYEKKQQRAARGYFYDK